VTVGETRWDIHPVDERDIETCYPLMRQLRPHLGSAADFAERWRRQRTEGYRLVGVWKTADPVALAGFRVTESLIHGRFLYVDDLVVDIDRRNGGFGALLMDWLHEEGRNCGCAKLVLDTGLDNVLAHRFYYRQGLVAMALRFNSRLG